MRGTILLVDRSWIDCGSDVVLHRAPRLGDDATLATLPHPTCEIVVVPAAAVAF